MPLLAIAILLILLTPVIVILAMLAAALWTLGQIAYEHDWTRASTATPREPLDAGKLTNAAAHARSLS